MGFEIMKGFPRRDIVVYMLMEMEMEIWKSGGGFVCR